jgi:hypothetical protein
VEREHHATTAVNGAIVNPLPSIHALKGEALALRNSARAAGKSLRHQPALNLVAAKYGYPNWEALTAAAEKQQRLLPENPFFRDLQRGTVDAQWEPSLTTPCFWSPHFARVGKPAPLFAENTVRELVAKFPAKFAFSGAVVLVQGAPESFAALAYGTPSNVSPIAARYEGTALTLYALPPEDWSDVRASGAAAKALEQLAREYVARYPGAAPRHPEYFPDSAVSRVGEPN